MNQKHIVIAAISAVIAVVWLKNRRDARRAVPSVGGVGMDDAQQLVYNSSVPDRYPKFSPMPSSGNWFSACDCRHTEKRYMKKTSFGSGLLGTEFTAPEVFCPAACTTLGPHFKWTGEWTNCPKLLQPCEVRLQEGMTDVLYARRS